MQNVSYENELDLHESYHAGKTHFEWFHNKTCFDTEAKDNSEMAYYLSRGILAMNIVISGNN